MHAAVISKELHFLISLCSLKSSQVREYVSGFDGLESLDDSKILRLSKRHRIEPLVWSIIRPYNIFSNEIREGFETAFRQNQLKALQAKALQDRLYKLIDRFGMRGVFLKGLGIAERYYDDIAQRHVLDIDLYVGEDGLDNMINGLKELGYCPYPDATAFNQKEFDFFKLSHHDIYFASISENGLLPVELHWRISGQWSDFKIDPKTGFNTIDEFLYLCVHGTEHGWFRLKWLMDLPRIIKIGNFDWRVLRARAGQLGCIDHLFVTLVLMDELHIFPFPAVLSDQVSKKRYQYQLNYIFDAMTSESHFNESDKKRWQYFKYLWSFRANNFSFAFFIKFMSSPKDWQIIRLPKKWFFLYFILRPFLWTYRRITGA
jgi:hypothetical protein